MKLIFYMLNHLKNICISSCLYLDMIKVGFSCWNTPIRNTRTWLTYWHLGDANLILDTLSQLILVIDSWIVDCETAVISMPLDWGESTLIQVMAWCRQATSHYLNQCCPSSVMPYGFTMSQRINSYDTISPDDHGCSASAGMCRHNILLTEDSTV